MRVSTKYTNTWKSFCSFGKIRIVRFNISESKCFDGVAPQQLVKVQPTAVATSVAPLEVLLVVGVIGKVGRAKEVGKSLPQ